MKSSLIFQEGFSLITALFVLIVFATLGAYMAGLFSLQTQTVNLSLVESKVLAAARLGAEYGIYRGVSACACPADDNFTLAQGAYAGFNVQVNVTCTFQVYQEGGSRPYDRYRVYFVNSTATYGVFGAPEYVSRQMSTTGTDLFRTGLTCATTFPS